MRRRAFNLVQLPVASLCLMYKTRGVEHMEFNDDDSDTKRQTDVDFKCR